MTYAHAKLSLGGTAIAAALALSATLLAAQEAVSTDPAAEAPVAPEAAVPLAAIEPPAPAPQPEETMAIDPDVLPIAGAAGLGLLALAGAGMAVRRRRRREEANEWAEVHSWDQPAVAEPAFVRPEPVMAAPVAATAASAATAPAFAAPAGSSPRIRAAYAGPSPDNPSASLKKRLKRARALDQMERRNGTVPTRPVAAATAPQELQPLRSAFVFRRPSEQPVFQY